MSRRRRAKKSAQPQPTRPNPLREQLRAFAKDRRQDVIRRQQTAERHLESDPEYPARLREDCQRAIRERVAELRTLLGHCVPLVRKIKNCVPIITDETVDAACYLLFSHALQSFEAVLVLGPHGFNHQIGELLRGVREALDLAVLFMLEGQRGAALRKWLSGEFVSNDAARQAFGSWINEGRAEPIDAAGTKSAIYEALSHYSHMSYVGLLESLDVFSGDFDTSMTSGLLYVTHSALPMAKTQLDSMLVALKQFYTGHRDLETVTEINRLRALF